MKTIIICSDGTWQSPESDTGSHVLRIARGIAPEDNARCKQVVFYDWGLGSDGSRFSAGITGQGIDKNILDCYRFLVHNYDVGDRLYLFGFSRGAYTVRSLAGLIHNSGILRREHAQRVGEAYPLYRLRSLESSPGRTRASRFRQAFAHADVSRVHFVGVFDTVGLWAFRRPSWVLWATTVICFMIPSPARSSTMPATWCRSMKTVRTLNRRCGNPLPGSICSRSGLPVRTVISAAVTQIIRWATMPPNAIIGS